MNLAQKTYRYQAANLLSQEVGAVLYNRLSYAQNLKLLPRTAIWGHHIAKRVI